MDESKTERYWEKVSARRAYFHAYREVHKDKLNAAVKAWQKANPERYKEQRRQSAQKAKLRCFTHYSSDGDIKCACCGESNIKFLTIDHINNDGADHRRKINKYNIYHWLTKNKYPEGYQILCYNCNCGKWHNNGICPHKE